MRAPRSYGWLVGSRSPGAREVWRRQSTKRALEATFIERFLGTRVSGRDGQSAIHYERNLAKNIRRVNHSIRRMSYQFSAYQLVLKSKGRDKFPRVISLPVVRDRLVLRALATTLNIVSPRCSIELAQSKVSRVSAALSSEQFSHFLKLDVQDFYPSIEHTWLRATLKRAIGYQPLVELFMDAVRTPTLSRTEKHRGQVETTGVPQGLAISNGLAELAVQHVDDMFANDQRVAYFRYVDDVLILMSGDLSSELLPKLKRALRLAGLEAHPVKVGSTKSAVGAISQGFEFLGYKFDWPRVSVRNGSINRLEATLARTFTRYRYAVARRSGEEWKQSCTRRLEWHLNLVITGCVFEGNRLGWLAYFSQIRHHQLLEHLDALVAKQFARHQVTGISPKTFLASYRYAASRRADETGFVPNFDTTSNEEMRRTLVDIFMVDARRVSALTDEMSAELFKRRIRGVVVELERDIQSGY